MNIWDNEKKELNIIYESYIGHISAIDKELEQLVNTNDPNVALLYSRRCLEVIMTDLCESELNRPRKTEPLKGIVDKLKSEEKVPIHITSSMYSLIEMSNYGAHPKDFDPEQVKPVLINLAIIIKWYMRFKDIKDINSKLENEIQNSTTTPDLKVFSSADTKRRIIIKTVLLIAGVIIAMSLIVVLYNKFSHSSVAEPVKRQLIHNIPIIVFDNNDDIYSCNIDGKNVSQLTSGSSIDCNPRINYQKNKVAFYSNRTGRWEIFIMNLEGKESTQLTTQGVSGGQNNSKTGGMDWTPDGKIVYIIANKIFEINGDGSGTTEIATAPSDNWADLRISPNGEKIIALTRGDLASDSKMYIMNLDGSNCMLFAPEISGLQLLGCFSEDAKRILWSYDVSGQNWDFQIISMKLDGSETSNLSTTKPDMTNDLKPLYLPEDGKIIFINYNISNKKRILWIMDQDGRNRKQLENVNDIYSFDCK